MAPDPLVETSQNSSFAFLTIPNPLLGLTPPAFASFDPFAAGEYSFAIANANERLVAINVNVVPVPATLALFGLGLLCLGLRRR